MADVTLLVLAVENAELQLHLAEAQELAIEMAVDAGALHAEIEALREPLVEAERERDAWRQEAEAWRGQGRAVARR